MTAALVAILTSSSAPAPLVVPKVGIVLSASCKLKPGDYLLPTPQGERKANDEVVPDLKPAITIRGNNLVVDFSQVTLRGTRGDVDPDQRKGLGVEVIGNNVTIKNLSVRGYKVGLIARNCNGLKVIGGDFSYNWKQRLLSTPAKEDLSDWMSYHHNEKDEWLRYGAAIYLSGCNRFEVKGIVSRGGQCALMMSRCENGLVWNNDLSFNSGLGLGMYRSSKNRIQHNRIDWNVRGFSYGVYNRGQDSAGILIFEQCHQNTFAYNSVTHGGDGFFLWAGQQTMDSGEGGCNDNVLYANDFSHAPTNGVEATFSRNVFANNRVLECWHGVWGGYSYDTPIVGNTFGLNSTAIAIEHGQDISIAHNLFARDYEGIQLWKNASQDPNWGYPKHHDTRSRDYLIMRNVFSDISQWVYKFSGTSGIRFMADNRFVRVKTAGTVSPNCENAQIEKPFMTAGTPLPSTYEGEGKPLVELDARPSEYLARFNLDWSPWFDARKVKRRSHISEADARALAASKWRVEPLKGGMDPFLAPSALRGLRYIFVDDWGPYDFKRPILVPRQMLNPGVVGNVTRRRFEILGPVGTWKVVSTNNVEHLSQRQGEIPGFVDVDLPVGKAGKTSIVLEYRGSKTTDVKGLVTPAGKPVRFAYETFYAPIDWTVSFYRWSKAIDPKDPHSAPEETAFQAAQQVKPILTKKVDELDFSGAAFFRDLPNDHYATVAEGDFSIAPGDYVLDITADDGVRIWLDGKLVLSDAWHYQAPTSYSVPARLGGAHKLKVEHFQIDGYAALKVKVRPQ